MQTNLVIHCQSVFSLEFRNKSRKLFFSSFLLLLLDGDRMRVRERQRECVCVCGKGGGKVMEGGIPKVSFFNSFIQICQNYSLSVQFKSNFFPFSFCDLTKKKNKIKTKRKKKNSFEFSVHVQRGRKKPFKKKNFKFSSLTHPTFHFYYLKLFFKINIYTNARVVCCCQKRKSYIDFIWMNEMRHSFETTKKKNFFFFVVLVEMMR